MSGTPPLPGMSFVPGGTFDMGDERFYPEEAPVRQVEVDGLWMDGQNRIYLGSLQGGCRCSRARALLVP